MTFEDFILRWMPGNIALVVRFIPELLLYGLAFYICGSKLLRGETLKKTPIDLLLVAFIFATAVSIIINGAAIKGSIINLRTIWRYLSVFYIVVNINISNSELSKLLSGLKKILFIQALISSIQYFLPPSFNQAFFAPQDFEVEGFKYPSHAAAGTLKVGATAGTFSSSAVLASLLLVAACIFFAESYISGNSLIPDIAYLKQLGFTFFGIFASKKRAALVIFLLIPLVLFHSYNRPKKLLSFIWLYAALGLVCSVLVLMFGSGPSFSSSASVREEAIPATEYILQLFSPDYWEASNESARGWFVRVIHNAILSTQSWFGFGPDFDNTQRAISDTLSTARDIDKLKRDERVFDDSFWAASVAYFGIIGTAIYAFILKRLYDTARWLCRYGEKPEYKVLGGTFTTLLAVTVLYAFVERVVRLRTFSFYFWLLAGLVVNMFHVQVNEFKNHRTHKEIEIAER
ncbi:MAG: hypothetical protein AAF821_12300 [Cyanobacteria bacterium P01_D01_bin.156]